ncbi:hypothetical protein M0804_007718 [Polistes exclamans]|nr:hypothetical protein M0804_007718 [Polistes exclamans]
MLKRLYYAWDANASNEIMSIGGRKFPCSNCPSVFGQKHSLTRHLKYECCQEPRFQCSECRYRCKRAANVYKHVRMMHRESEVCAIDLVTNRVFRPSEFYYAWNTKTNNDSANNRSKKFPCPNCPSAFGQKPSLTRHLKYECGQEPRFQCPYCHHRSKKTSDVYCHIRRKHTELKVFAIDIHNDFKK